MKIFIIGPVRKADEKVKNRLELYVSILEGNGHQVHLPHRDTDQAACGFDICHQNMEAIRDADEVMIVYDPDSQGVHFDMGVAFALGKKIVIVEPLSYGEGKSYPRMLDEWSKRV